MDMGMRQGRSRSVRLRRRLPRAPDSRYLPSMSDGRVIVRNFLSLSAGQAIGFAFGLATTILLARTLGPETFGILGFGQALVAFAGIVVVLGTDTYGAREIARNAGRAGTLIGDILGFRTVLAAVAIPAVICVAALLGVSGMRLQVLTIQAVGLVATVMAVDFAFQGIQRMGPIAVRQSVASGLVFVGAALLVAGPGDVRIAAMLPLAAVAATSIWLLFLFQRTTAPIRVRFSPGVWRGWLGVVLPIGLGGLSVAIFQQVDIAMLGFLVPEAEVGRYVALVRLYVIVTTVGNLLAAVYAPVLAPLAGSDANARLAAYRPFAGAVLVMGGPAAAAMAAFPTDVVALFFGAAYAVDPGVVVIVMMSALLFVAISATSVALVAWDDQLFHSKALGVSAALNVALNAFLIPPFGLRGAAIATLLSAAALLAAEVVRLARTHGVGEVARPVKTLILLAVVFGAAYYLRQLLLPSGAAPALVVGAFGGGGVAAFFAAAAAAQLIDAGRLAALLRRG
jgi:O-antigen/teichoic acid export membrane protein